MKRLLAGIVAIFAGPAMSDPIAEVDGWLREHRPDYYEGLNPGVDEAAFDAFEAQFDIVLPEDFRRLYLWRDGHGAYVAPSLIHNLMFPPLAAVADTKAFLDDMIGHDFPDTDFWERHWIPFLDNGGGDYLTLATDGTGQGGAVIMFYHDDPYRGEEAPSFSQWLSGLRAALEDSADL